MADYGNGMRDRMGDCESLALEPRETEISVRKRKDLLWLESSGFVIVIGGWPNMRAWRRKKGKPGWMRFNPCLDVSTGMIAPAELLGVPLQPTVPLRMAMAGAPPSGVWNKVLASYASVRDFLGNIPDEIKRIVGRYQCQQWEALQFLQLGGSRALDLMQTNPALASCITAGRRFSKTFPPAGKASVDHLLSLKRREICGLLGFPARERTVGILSKIAPEDCRIADLLRFQTRLRVSWVAKTLAHLPKINRAILGALKSESWESLTSSFLVAISHGTDDPGTLQEQLAEAARIYQAWKRRKLPRGRFRNVQQLSRFLQEIETGYNREETARLLSKTFPQAPFPGTDTIIPLDSVVLLLEEGRLQGNCVARKFEEIAAGETYFYRMTAPERATFCINRSACGWVLGEILGPGNRPVGIETCMVARAWWQSQQSADKLPFGKEK